MARLTAEDWSPDDDYEPAYAAAAPAVPAEEAPDWKTTVNALSNLLLWGGVTLGALTVLLWLLFN